MIKTILHQIWNQRRQNGWIFIELLIVSFFLWTVVDPIAVLTGQRLLPRGYESQRRYVVRINAYAPGNGAYNAGFDSDSVAWPAYRRIIRELSEMPEIDSYVLANSSVYPNSTSWNGGTLYTDTASAIHKTEGHFIDIQNYTYVALGESNLFRTYGMKDALTGEEMRLPEDFTDKVFLSEYAARSLYGTADVVGRRAALGTSRELTIAGVFQDYKHRDYDQPFPLVVEADRDIANYGTRYLHFMYVFVFKLKDGVDADAFEARFHSEVAPRLKQGNYYIMWLKELEKLSDEYASMAGIKNQLRLYYSLGGFALLSIFLGMVGTFWIRCNARRQEIGVMRSMGAARVTITRQFLLEAALLVTVAFGVMLIPIYIYADLNGFVTFGNQNGNPNPDYWMNRFAAHYWMVTAISYFVLLATALVGTYIPVHRAASILPADALRDE